MHNHFPLLSEKLRSIIPKAGDRIKVVAGEWVGANGVIEEVYEDLSLKVKLKLWDKTFSTTLPLDRVLIL